MTYCVGMLVNDGLVMIADTRTNAGLDNISCYRKLHVLARDDDRFVVAATAGNLSITQLILSQLEEGLEPLVEGDPPRTLKTVPSMFQAVKLVGEAIGKARREVGQELEASSIDFGVTFLLGGQIGPGKLRLYLIYKEGNFIECHRDAPFLQIGATQYGKPILDRALRWDTSLSEVVKVGLISFDSTIRSNLSVGRPLDLVVIPRDRSGPVIERRIGYDDEYFDELSHQWSELLQQARIKIPTPPFMD